MSRPRLSPRHLTAATAFLGLVAAARLVAASDHRPATVVLVAALATAATLFIRRFLVQTQQLERALAEQARENQIKDRMITALSTELRMPLAGIYAAGFAMQEEGFGDPAFHADMTDIIVSESADLSRMVDDLLVAATTEAADLPFLLEPVTVQAEVAEVLASLGARAEGFTVDCRPATLMIDQSRFRHLLTNLVSNAVTHGGRNKAITGTLSESRYILAVHDDGPGVPANIESKIFDRFVVDDDAPLLRGSLGLGLYVARMLARRMGGDITYQRRDGITSFVATLPAAADTAPAKPSLMGSPFDDEPQPAAR